MSKDCHLRKTPIKLLDGKEYSFRALPASKKNLPLLRKLMGMSKDADPVDSIDLIADAVEVSLSFDYGPGKGDEFIERGLIQLLPSSEEEHRVLDDIMGALLVQGAKLKSSKEEPPDEGK